MPAIPTPVTPLLDALTEPIDVGMELLRAAPEALAHSSAEELRERFDSAMARARQRVAALQMAAADVDAALFAVVCWFDEVVARAGLSGLHTESAQARLYGTANGGEEFFLRVSALSQSQAAVRDVYHFLLSMGFEGRYFLETEPGGPLRRLREGLLAGLTLAPAGRGPEGVQSITTQPQEVTDPPTPVVRTAGGLRLKVAVAAALLLPTVFVLGPLLWQGRASGPDDASIASAVAQVPCVRVQFRVQSPGRVYLSGVVPGAEDVPAVVARVATVPGVSAVEHELVVQPRPFCAIEAVVAQHGTRQADRLPQVRFVSRHNRGPQQLVEGDEIHLEVKAPSGFQGYMAVDYYDRDGNVVHLYPGAWDKTSTRPVSGGQTIEVRRRDMPWVILPPFGEELIVVMLSDRPLSDGLRAEAEPAALYVESLRGQLAASTSPGRLAATLLYVKTHPAKR